MGTADATFAGSVPQLYERLMVPLIFAFYAREMAARVAALHPARVLEIAAGTGALTRQLALQLPVSTPLVATDLNLPMLEQARSLGASRAVTWQQADAQALPFPDGSFDCVVIQFGAMFFPDRPRAYAEARRVLATGGTLLLSVWDRLETNELADIVTQALAALYPDDPPRFMARTPHGYCDPGQIARDLAAGGFTAPPAFTTLPGRSPAPHAREAAVAYCQGTPLRGEIESRGGPGLDAATNAAEAAIARRFGTGPVDAGMQAVFVQVAR